MKKLLLLSLLVLSVAAFCAEITVKPENAVIVTPPGTDGIARFAAQELQYHLKLYTGKTIPIVKEKAPGKYAFIFGRPAGVKLKPEESVWEVTPEYARLYGDSEEYTGKPTSYVLRLRRTGDLTAVYDFLEKQLHFLFLSPGPLGTSFDASPVLKLQTGKNSWDPGQLKKRGLRFNVMKPADAAKDMRYPEFYRQKAKTWLPKYNVSVYRWLKQQRMGASVFYRYGHAFTEWWNRYGKTHPEYFAYYLGKRAPFAKPSVIKMCVSNPGFRRQIIENWKSRKPLAACINVCENDWEGFCECAECRKLDMPPLPGKAWNYDLSDRYLNMANAIMREARKIDPKVLVGYYAYGAYRFPPRRERVEPGIVIGLVPSMMTPELTEQMYKGWRARGAKEMFQRPNDQHINTGMPMGFEKYLFDHFLIGVKNGIVGTDYDSLHGFWDTTGLADYILARAHIDPSKSFEYWVDEYCSAFGPAAPEVKAYFDYFRTEVFGKRLVPHRAAIAERGRYGNFRRGLMWDMPKYYFEKDFDLTDAILKKGLAKKLTPGQKAQLERLLLANRHARLTLRAMAATGSGKLAAAKALHQFREENWEKLNFNWYRLFTLELEFGDVTGGRLADRLRAYSEGASLPLLWQFTPDPEGVGEKKNYPAVTFDEAEACWERVRTDAGWENPGPTAHPRMREFMKNYDGVGWYSLRLAVPPQWKGREVYLLFAGVDESAWVYLNGKFCGERLFKDRDDWKKPFEIRIDPAIDWSKKYQSLIVKVKDIGGQGGIWRPVSIAVK